MGAEWLGTGFPAGAFVDYGCGAGELLAGAGLGGFARSGSSSRLR
jgi:hypothetical protein